MGATRVTAGDPAEGSSAPPLNGAETPAFGYGCCAAAARSSARAPLSTLVRL